MNRQDLWQRYQDWLYYLPSLDFYVDISRMGFSDYFVTTLEPKFNQAFQDIAALEKGAIANPDENRMVGHYWLRNPDLAPNDAIRAEITEPLTAIKGFASAVHDGSIKPPFSSVHRLIGDRDWRFGPRPPICGPSVVPRFSAARHSFY